MLKLIYRLLTAGFAGFVAYSGYCVYTRAKQQEIVKKCSYEQFESITLKSELEIREASKSTNYVHLCELNTPFARRDYFMKKIKAANDCIDSGNMDEGIQELIEAIAVCSKPAALLECMSNTLPIDTYKKLIEKLSSLA